MLKGNCRKKNLTTCERKISSHKPAFSHFRNKATPRYIDMLIYVLLISASILFSQDKFCFLKKNLFIVAVILQFSRCVKIVRIWSFSCPYSVFSFIQTEYGDLQSTSPYSVQMQKNTDQKPRNMDIFKQYHLTIMI